MSIKSGKATIDEKTYKKLKRAQLLRVYDNGDVVFVYDRIKEEEQSLKQVGKKMADKLIEEGFYSMEKRRFDRFYEYERRNSRFYIESFRLGLREE